MRPSLPFLVDKNISLGYLMSCFLSDACSWSSLPCIVMLPWNADSRFVHVLFLRVCLFKSIELFLQRYLI